MVCSMEKPRLRRILMADSRRRLSTQQTIEQVEKKSFEYQYEMGNDQTANNPTTRAAAHLFSFTFSR